MDFRNRTKEPNVPLTTIGVLSYNYTMFIDEALDSLLTQTYPNIELIIVDDCSSDNCPEKIENWIKKNNIHCTYIKHKNNKGITKTSNEIVSLATGKYITLFATDDIMLPERIEKQVQILEECSDEYGLCYANVELIDEDGHFIGYHQDEQTYNFKEGDVLYDYITRNFRFATPVSLVRLAVYKKTGLYDEGVLIEDFNFFIRLFALYKVKYCEYHCLKYRVKKHSNIHSHMSENHSERYYHDRILSIHRGLKYTSDKKARKFYYQKIDQYLKSLAIGNSRYFPGMFRYLLLRGYFVAPYKAAIVSAKKRVRALFSKQTR